MRTRERNLMLAIAAAALTMTGLWLAFRDGASGGGPLAKAEAQWSFTPSWGGGPADTPPADASGQGGRLDVYVDGSQPMGGFLGDGQAPGSAFEAVLRSASDQLLRVDGGVSSPVAFFGVAEKIEKIDRERPLEARFYRGGQSRLDKALAEVERTLTSGETEAALVLTDLIATGDVVGAQGAAQPLRDFMRSAEVRSGQRHLGLLGVKGEYRGVRRAGCPAPAGQGCRFSEQREKWLPHEDGALVPFYLLVFARERAQVERILAGFADELAELEIDTASEILSAANEMRPPVETECRVAGRENPARRQYALRGERGGLFSCGRDEKVMVSCALPPEPRPLAAEKGKPEDWLEYSLAGERLDVELDCERIRDRNFALSFEFSARSEGPAEEKWEDWSSTSDDRPEDVGRTLRLKDFVAKLRLAPGAYQVAVKLSPREGAE